MESRQLLLEATDSQFDVAPSSSSCGMSKQICRLATGIRRKLQLKTGVYLPLQKCEVTDNSRKRASYFLAYAALAFFSFILIEVYLNLNFLLLQFDVMRNVLLFAPTSTYNTLNEPTFVRPPGTEELDCGRLFDDQDYVTQVARHRIQINDSNINLTVSCSDILLRNHFPTQPASEAEAQFPLAEARIVFRDYLLVEMELAAGYAPQNWYCFAVDKKADQRFHERMKVLASCLPNVILLPHDYRMDSAGHNLTSSYMDCLQTLRHPDRPWKYVSLLQNHDISTKTNAETVQIFEWLNGANDVELKKPPGGRFDPSLDWSFKGLHLFRNGIEKLKNCQIYLQYYSETRNRVSSPSGFAPKLLMSKGYSENSLTREMVDFMFDTLDLSEFLRRIERAGFGTDELLVPTLNAADAIGAPGGFTRACLDAKNPPQHLTRHSIWNYDDARVCPSGYKRHSICLLGVEDLTGIMERTVSLFANKMMQDFDWGAVVCWYERLLNRTHGIAPSATWQRRDYYTNLPYVRFQQAKSEAAKRQKPVDLSRFNCSAPPVPK